MTFKEIELAVKREIEDFSIEFLADIPLLINEVYFEVIDTVDPGVPELQTIGSVSTVVGKAFLSQPPDSSGKVSSLFNPLNSEKLEMINGDLDTLRDRVGSLTRTGGVVLWVPIGTLIYYTEIPLTAVPLDIIYYRLPTELVGDSDVPVEIPSHLHRSVLVHGTAFKIFSRIEQEGENEALETQKQFVLFTDGDDKFKAWVSRRQRVAGRKAADV